LNNSCIGSDKEKLQVRKLFLIFSSACLLVYVASVSVVQAQAAAVLNSEEDPIANLLDLYAFVDPHCQTSGGAGCEADPIELIVALTINPFATGAEQFSEDVVYHFYFENDSGAEEQIDCSFSAGQVLSCAGMGGLSAEARVGEIGVNGDLRVYAGLRDNPMFLDLDALESFKEIGIAAYTDPGVDSLAGSNVLAIVIGIKITAMSSGMTANHNVQKIWAASERIGGDGINGAISGSWYDPEQNGQGWVIEVVGGPSGESIFVGYFYGYDDNGEQLWFILGGAVVDGNQATSDVYRPSGIGFGGSFDPGSFVLGDVVGSVTFDFKNCNSASVTFNSADSASLADFNNDLIRLTNIASLDCSLLVAGQVDRVGRPFISGFIPDDMRNAYDTNSDPDTWGDSYTTVLLTSLNSFAMADGDPAWNGFYTAQDWAPVFADDRLQIDIKKAQSVDFMTIERSKIEGLEYEDSSGRSLDYDIHENLFNVLITSFDPFVDDFVAGNDVPYLNQFPFLAPPHN
jgi:hypothetical protein